MSFTATHVVPASGLPTWPSPDSSAAGGPERPRLAAGTPVDVMEQRADGWAQVRCENGWTAWVDGRLVFNDESLRDVAAELSRWFDVDIRVVGGPLAKLERPRCVLNPEHRLAADAVRGS